MIKNWKLGLKLNLLMVGVLLITSLAIGVTVAYKINSEVKKVAVEKAKTDLQLGYGYIDSKYPGDWVERNGQLYKGDILVNENDEIVDNIADITGGTVTVFLGDTRVTTNVVRDGNRVNGTTASPEIVEKVLKNGQNYYGEADVVGNKYQTAYQPIMNKENEIIGMWYVGASEAFIDKTIASTLNGIFIAIIITIVISLVIMILFVKTITKPILTSVSIGEK